ncbi:oxidoreductase domain-containing protein [Kickxella alabastrina]|uniref:oxidoreductase domain-containing protein n=1 Tax=Kickxella alabastrina TaxID=61397 RepID=UPI00221EFC82|nr:oxidoreductase domain-containing protein [Kickxella alabastrina]KAI7821121.1 oxidoreductase domain-containing protein [Kickxella alabastrina]
MASQNTRIKVGVVGFGMSARVFHCPLIASNSNYELVAVVERHAAQSKRLYPQVQVVSNIDELLAIPDISLVIITTPNDTHVSYVKQTLLAGKNCVVEKPFTVTEAEARDLACISKETGNVLSVFQNRRWDGDYLTVKRLMANNALGEVVEIESRFDRFRAFKKQNAWREVADFPGSGILYDLGAHLFDQIVDLVGVPEMVRNERKIEGAPDDSFLVVLDYPSKNFKALCRAGMLVRDKPPRFTVLGMRGTFTKYGLDEGVTPANSEYGKDKKEQFGTIDSEIYPELHVRGTAGLIVTPEQAANVIRIIELAKQSSAERKSLPF